MEVIKMINSKITKDALLSVGREIKDGLQQDGLKWFKPFLNKGLNNSPKNAITGYVYQGINWWNLSFVQNKNKYKTPLFASKNAWLKTGATIKPDQVKKGEPIFYWWQNKITRKTPVDTINPENPDNYYQRWFLKITWGFNVDQVDLTNSTWKMPVNKPKKNKVKNNLDVFNFVDNQKGLVLKHSNEARCYYAPELDYIHMANKINFNDTKNGTCASFEYYSVLLHELIHWTGHKTRTKRFEKNLKFFKDNQRLEYALEELIAEIGSNLLCIKFDMQKKVNKNSLAYLKTWISALSNNDVFIYKALSQSSGAIDFLNNNLKEIKAKKTA
jgi:antirestriction protein ArdC